MHHHSSLLIFGGIKYGQIFFQCVDDFGIKHFNDDDIQHLLGALIQHYTVSCDWAGENCCGLKLEWNYKQYFVKASMPNYIKELLKKLKYTSPAKPVHAPHKWSEPVYGQKFNMRRPAMPHYFQIKRIATHTIYCWILFILRSCNIW